MPRHNNQAVERYQEKKTIEKYPRSKTARERELAPQEAKSEKKKGYTGELISAFIFGVGTFIGTKCTERVYNRYFNPETKKAEVHAPGPQPEREVRQRSRR